MQQLHVAAAFHNQRELDQAEEICRQVLAVDNNNFYALNFCGCICREKKRFDEGIDFLSRAVALQPDNPDAVYNLGNVFKDAERWDEAISCYEKTIGLRSEYPEALNNLGICLKEVERYEHSEIVLRSVVSVRPGFAGAWLNLGNTFNEQEKFEEAIASYRKAIEVKPDFAEAYFNLGNALQKEGEVEEAIESCRKAIEVNPDFADAYFNLGHVLNDVGRIDEARAIVAALREMKPPEEEALITIQAKSLVFDWHHRRALNLFWGVELASARIESTALAAVKEVDSLCFPTLFLGDQIARAQGKQLYEKGYLVDDALVTQGFCADLVSQFNDGNEPASEELVELVSINGVLESVLEKILLHTGFPHLVWNCIYLAKSPNDESASDAWHYDNHYNVWTPKLMIYLNSQQYIGGATHFVDAGLSRKISEISDYMGLVSQRDSYDDRVKGLVEELSLDPVTLNPEHYVFSPVSAGSGVWFCPARALHRGVSPKKGVRHVLSFSLTPLPTDCGWSVDRCVEKSVEILKDKIKRGMLKTDIIPYWIPSQVGSA